MWIKTHLKYENRRMMSVMAKSMMVLMLMSCAVGGAMAAENTSSTGIWDIFDKKIIVQAAKDAWTGGDGLGAAGGNMLIGIVVVIAFLSILIGLFGGVAVTNLGKLGADNDTHAKGKSMIGTAIMTAIMVAVGLCIIVMSLKGWL